MWGEKFLDNVQTCSSDEVVTWLQQSNHGLERECLRVDGKGGLSKESHSQYFGSKLTHPHISTDFSEAQLELITPYFPSEGQALNFLHQLHLYLYHHLGEESLWPFSSPCQLPQEEEIPLAYYGTSKQGMEKTLYRKGLGYRYGRKMQTLSGIHYNFSFSSQFLDFFVESFGSGESRKKKISQAYLGMIRNFLRMGWINTYLFGASPMVDKSFFEKKPKDLEHLNPSTLYAPYATSLRMSELGYYSKVQRQIAISYNDLPTYISDLRAALSNRCPRFSRIGIYKNKEYRQLSDSFLQLEAEHYSRIRPKPKQRGSCRVVDALEEGGVEYLEVRSLDIDPFVADGIEVGQLQFLHAFMLYCFFKPSPMISKEEQLWITENQNKVALFGRRPRLRLRRLENGLVSMKRWALEILKEMEEVAALLDRGGGGAYQEAIAQAKEKCMDPQKTPSAKLLQLLEKDVSFQSYGQELGQTYKRVFLQEKLPKNLQKKYENLAKNSLKQEELLEIYDDFILRGYEDMEWSTQMVIREAFERGVHVDLLDRGDNFIRLHKGNKQAFVKQATNTARDNIATYFLMENKEVTKKVLSQEGISVPKGKYYTSFEQASEDYPFFSHKKVVVKPNFSNYGIGIHFVEAGDFRLYQEALKDAFQYSRTVLVEEFFEGPEYRFLLIEGKVVAICERIPANVVGDGQHTIRQLVKKKNADPLSFKWHKYQIRLNSEEKENLKVSGLNFDSILPEGERVFLRKNSNVSTGGDPIDRTGQLHPDYEEIARQATQLVKATFCGLDMIIADKDKKPDPTNHAIIELNFNPALFLHRYPAVGEKRYVEKQVLDALGF